MTGKAEPSRASARWPALAAALGLGAVRLPLGLAADVSPPATAILGEADKAELAEVLRLQASLGDRVWPGFGSARIPIILYDDRHEFLIGAAAPPAPWWTVAADDFQGRPYHRRDAAVPQAFAVRVGAEWAGSIRGLDAARRRMPLPLSRDFHVVLVLHEMFHAFQARQNPSRFEGALAVYRREARYAGRAHAVDWNEEGRLLAATLEAGEDAELRRRAGEFLRARAARRARAALGPELVDYERELEWLEGLAKHVEIAFYEQASARPGEQGQRDYQPGLPYWQMDFARLKTGLGSQGGDLRFYLSGMAQARALDRLAPGWQTQALRDAVQLEDLLRRGLDAAR